MLDKAVTTPAPTGESNATPAPILLKYDAPERLELELNTDIADAKVKVKVNAPIMLPEHTLPIFTVKPKDITYEQIKSFVDLVGDGKPLYQNTLVELVPLKSDYQNRIDRYMWEIYV
jgi:hypothetical protein